MSELIRAQFRRASDLFEQWATMFTNWELSQGAGSGAFPLECTLKMNGLLLEFREAAKPLIAAAEHFGIDAEPLRMICFETHRYSDRPAIRRVLSQLEAKLRFGGTVRVSPSPDELKSIAGIGVAHANVYESHLAAGQPGTQPPNAMPALPPELHSLYDRIRNSTAAKDEVDLFVAFSFENHTLAGQSWGDAVLQGFLIEWMKTLTLEPSAASIRRAEIRKQILTRYPPSRIPFEQVRAHLDENRRLIEGAQFDGRSSYLFKIVLECHRMIRIGDPADLPTLPDKIDLTRAEALVKIEEYRAYCTRRIAEFDESERQPAHGANNAAHAKLTKGEANIKAREFLRENPNATARELATGIGCSSGLVSKLPAWQAVTEQRDKGRQPKKAVTVALTSKMEQAIGVEDEALIKLINEQQADAEPSPLQDDAADNRPGAPRRAKVYRKP